MSENTCPDSISFGELQEIMENANKEAEVKKVDTPFDGLSREGLEDLIAELKVEMEEKCGHPMAAKAMVWILLDALLEWHSRVGRNIADEGDEGEQAMGWLRDAGKFQAIFNILSTVEVCKEDFLTQ